MYLIYLAHTIYPLGWVVLTGDYLSLFTSAEFYRDL